MKATVFSGGSHLRLKTDAVTRDRVAGTGNHSPWQEYCPRAAYPFWPESRFSWVNAPWAGSAEASDPARSLASGQARRIEPCHKVVDRMGSHR